MTENWQLNRSSLTRRTEGEEWQSLELVSAKVLLVPSLEDRGSTHQHESWASIGSCRGVRYDISVCTGCKAKLPWLMPRLTSLTLPWVSGHNSPPKAVLQDTLLDKMGGWGRRKGWFENIKKGVGDTPRISRPCSKQTKTGHRLQSPLQAIEDRPQIAVPALSGRDRPQIAISVPGKLSQTTDCHFSSRQLKTDYRLKSLQSKRPKSDHRSTFLLLAV